MSSSESKRLLLEVIGESRAPVELPRSGTLTIGSDRERADVALDGQGVADVHCAIGKSKGGGFALKDLGSQFGTIVNGERVQSARLDTGDVIVLGSRRLRVIDPEGTKIEENTAPPAPASVAVPAPTRAEAPAPQRIRAFRVERVLGRGGMGEVLLATQEPLERPVALKLLSSTLARDADFVRRFLAEARAAAALSHPNVVVVYDAGEDAGRYYLAMEYMDRGNLESRVAKEGPLPWKEALAILIDAAKGLQFAEQKGIVHRDIKPANLMQNAAGTTKIADLGLAAHLDAEATTEGDRKIFGTPHFISPEQARGERVDARSDLYSLGATAYRLLSGRTPFEGATTRDILRGHFVEEPKSLAQLAPSVPQALAQSVHRLLAKKPEERYPSATALLADLERLRAPHAAPVAAGGKRSYGGVILFGLLAVAGIVAAIRFLDREKQAGPTLATPGVDAQGVGQPAPIEPGPVADAPRAEATGDEDTALKLRELEAEVAWRDLPPAADPAARRAALGALAQKFAGTTVAHRAAAESDELGRQIESEARAAGERKSTADALLEQLRAAAAGEPLEVPAGMRGLLAVPGQDAFSGDPDFGVRRRAIAEQRLQQGAAAAKSTLEQSERAGEQGDFARMEDLLRKVSQAGELPAMPADLDPQTIGAGAELAQAKRTADERLSDLPALRDRFRSARSKLDAVALVQGFGGPTGFENELRTLDFASAEARLGALEARIATEEARAFVHALRVDLAGGRKSLEAVGSAYASGGWRRKTVLDPRRGKGPNRNAVGADARGIQIESDGSAESIPWSAFGAHPRELNQLFYERLSRDYSTEERAGIASLMRLTAIVAAIDGTAEMLQTSRPANLTEGEVRDVLDGFALARAWAADGEQKERLDREAHSVELFTRALNLASNGQWTSAVAGLERLSAESQDALFFRMLSGGPQGVTLPEPTDAPAQPADSSPSKPTGGGR